MGRRLEKKKKGMNKRSSIRRTERLVLATLYTLCIHIYTFRLLCMVRDANCTYCGDLASVYTNMESSCCTPETNMILYISYASIFLKKNVVELKTWQWWEIRGMKQWAGG